MAETTSPPQRRKSPVNTGAILQSLGDAVQVTILLSDWKNFGLSERVCYHLDLLETLTTDDGISSPLQLPLEEEQSIPHDVCGVLSILECIPTVSWKDMSRLQRKIFRSKIREFNGNAQAARTNPSKPCYQPPNLPIRITTTTRVSFVYEVTRMTVVLDASPTLVSAFGTADSDQEVCAMDRVPIMIKSFFEALTEPVPTSYYTSTSREKIELWNPILAVTVLAVYPHGGKKEENNTCVLVRDFRIHDVTHVQLLTKKVKEWVLSHVECTIAERLNSAGVGLVGYDSWAIPKYTSSLRDLLDAGDVALDFLPSKARPCIVLATDCRSVSCEEILHLLTYEERTDVPIHILDLSSPSWHRPRKPNIMLWKEDSSNFLVFDPGGPSAFPLHMSDDSESLFAISRATGGSFFNSELLDLASMTRVGKVQTSSPLAIDQYLAFRRRALRPNAVQSYVLFAVSPLTQSVIPSFPQTLIHPAGNLVPPEHLLKPMGLPQVWEKSASVPELLQSRSASVSSLPPAPPQEKDPSRTGELYRQPHRKTFSTYMVNPVHIKGLLVLRAKEGFRAKKFGTSSLDPDKISIQLTLPIEHGTILHYELQYRALSPRNPLVGVAHVKVEISGNTKFVQKMKDEFLTYTSDRNVEVSRLVKVVWWLRREDLLQSFLCPISWGEKALSPTSPTVRRLGSLSRLQRVRNFRIDRFDVVCTGRIPHAYQDEIPWGDIVNDDNGEQELFDTLSSWSTQVLEDQAKYMKLVPASDNLRAYCIAHVSQSPMASRLFGITVDTIGGCSVQNRLAIIEELKSALRKLRDVAVLSKRMYGSLVGVPASLNKPSHHAWRAHFLESHFEHEEWKPVKDPELLGLLMRRRIEIGKFFLLHSTDTCAVFAKDISVESGKVTTNPNDDVRLVIYRIELNGETRQPKVSMHVEKEVSCFATSGVADHMTLAHHLCMRVKRSDQECSIALRSRTNLLGLFPDVGEATSLDHPKLKEDVERLLAYASSHSRQLRFFHGFPIANIELERLTVELILSDLLTGDVVKLDIDPMLMVSSQSPGHWFLLRLDRHTQSFLHLPLFEKLNQHADHTYGYRELAFFTFGISDLYCVRDRGSSGDNESMQGHISEYLAIEEFGDVLEAVHKTNYALAAFLALRSLQGRVEEFSRDDFELVLDVCEFTKVAEVFLSQEFISPDRQIGSSKLMETIESLLTPIPGNDSLMFYSAEVIEPPDDPNGDELAVVDFNDDPSFHDDLSSDDSASIGNDVGMTRARVVDQVHSQSVPPVFVKFSVDGKDVQFHHLKTLECSVNLSIHMSIFKSMPAKEGNSYATLPPLHAKVSFELENALKSYVAEQTLERLRTNMSSIGEVDLGIVQKCMRKARNVMVSFIDVHFFVAKSNRMVAATNQASSEFEIEAGFKLLISELQAGDAFMLMPAASESFCVVDVSQGESTVRYWGFITIQRSLGLVTIEVYHPKGSEYATSTLDTLRNFVARTCHRTNQLLLLDKLHRTRSASSYLIRGSDDEDTGDGMFQHGYFSCPAKFEECFDLYHRCSAPKVIASLISTTLHSFAVSNRRWHFVYKDEAMSIFYLSLSASENESPEHVKLIVYGVQEPGASVTVQLTLLLRKKILQLAVETLSLVLNKNPHFSWKNADMEFVERFHRQRFSEQDPMAAETGIRVFFVEFPGSVDDPLGILLYFRQNICGSTYFHRLNEANSDELVSPNDLSSSVEVYEADEEIVFDQSEFVFFYNNTPSPLDQSFQALSTLTSKGKLFADSAGKGIAIIQLSLVRKSDSSDLATLKIAAPPGRSVSQLTLTSDMLRVREVLLPKMSKSAIPVHSKSDFLFRFRLTGTAIKLEALKDWIILTLNQVLAAWLVERHIQRSSTGLLIPLSSKDDLQESSSQLFTGDQRLAKIDKLCPGLPRLTSMLRLSAELPHPAVKIVEFSTVMMASAVASYTIGLLRDCLVTNLLAGKGSDESFTSLLSQTLMIRSSRKDQPEIVTLSSSPGWRGVGSWVESVVSDKTNLRDSPIDSPEYLCFFCWERYSNCSKEKLVDEMPMVFPEVSIGDVLSEKKASTFWQRLSELKKKLPTGFFRSLAFVLSVKRNRQSLILYNWDPKTVAKVLSDIKSLDAATVSATGVKLRSSQQRCLRRLAPFVRQASLVVNKGSSVGKGNRTDQTPRILPTASAKRVVDQMGGSGPPRRTQRATFIRRPKLVGKSVEGGAMLAMAASRAKARANTKTPARHSTAGVVHEESESTPMGDAEARELKAIEEEVDSERFLRNFGEALSPPWGARFAMRTQNFELLQEYWFRSSHALIRSSSRDAVLQQTKPLWGDTALINQLSRRLSDDFSAELTLHLQSILEGIGACKIVPTFRNNAGGEDNSTFLMTVLEKARMTSFLVTRLSVQRSMRMGTSAILKCNTWMMRLLPPHGLSPSLKRFSRCSIEKRAASVGSLLGIAYQFKMRVDARLFDYSAGLVHRAASQSKVGVLSEEYLRMTESLVQGHPFDEQQRLPELEYRAFDATIILTSYEDKLIDKFNSHSLFKHFYALPNPLIVKCGPDAILFNTTINVQETITWCFLKRCRRDKLQMELVFLSQTRGRDLENYIFPDRSSVAATIFKLIVLEGARLAYLVIRQSAIMMHRDLLWVKASANARGPLAELDELLSFVSSTSAFSGSDMYSILRDEELEIDPESLFLKMSRDPVFTPHRKIRVEANGYDMVFFNNKLDVFIMFNVINRQIVDIKLLHRTEITSDSMSLFVETFTQYLLFFMWKS